MLAVKIGIDLSKRLVFSFMHIKMKITSPISCFDSLHTTFNDDTHIFLVFTVLFLSIDTDYKMTLFSFPIKQW